MRKEDINILKLKKKNNLTKKNEIKISLLRGLVNNRCLPKTYRNFAFYKLSLKVLPRKFHHVCLKHNKAAAVNNKFYVSKYRLKRLISSNKAQNISINS